MKLIVFGPADERLLDHLSSVDEDALILGASELDELKWVWGQSRAQAVVWCQSTSDPARLASDVAAFVAECQGSCEVVAMIPDSIHDAKTHARTDLEGPVVGDALVAAQAVVRLAGMGVREFLPWTASRELVQEALVRVMQRQTNRPQDHRREADAFGYGAPHRATARGEAPGRPREPGVCVVLTGLKGGCGVTTVAASLACFLAAHTAPKRIGGVRSVETSKAQRVVVLDMCGGDLDMHLCSSPPKTSLMDLCDGVKRLDGELLKALVTNVRDGLDFIAYPRSGQEIPDGAHALVSSASVLELIRVLKQWYSHILIDMGGLDLRVEAQLAAPHGSLYRGIESEVDLLVAVGLQDLPSLRRLRQFFATSVDGVAASRPEFGLVINQSAQAEPAEGLGLLEFGKTSGVAWVQALPPTQGCTRALLAGQALSERAGSQAYRAAVERVGQRLCRAADVSRTDSSREAGGGSLGALLVPIWDRIRGRYFGGD